MQRRPRPPPVGHGARRDDDLETPPEGAHVSLILYVNQKGGLLRQMIETCPSSVTTVRRLIFRTSNQPQRQERAIRQIGRELYRWCGITPPSGHPMPSESHEIALERSYTEGI